MTMPVEVFTAGEAMALLLADGHQPLPVADRFVRSFAGSESNVAIGLARLGHRVAFCGRVGADVPGRWIREGLRAEGVDVAGLVTDPDRATGLLLRDSPAGRPVTVSYYRTHSAGSALGSEDLQPRQLTGVRCIFLSGITPMLSATAAEFTERLLDVAEARAIHVVFDPNVRLRLAPASTWRTRLTPILERVDTLLVGNDELVTLGMAGKEATDLLTERRRTVVIKSGAAGAVAARADELVRTEARVVPSVDPVGAGDAFCAGWLSATLRGCSLTDAAREAALVASLVVASTTDIAGYPTAELRDRLLEENGPDVDR
jgi:2-dehydro-3-deoxygluconokinase